jgi:hypothetical protein
MSPRVTSRRWWLVPRLAAATTVWAIGRLLAALLVPASSSETSSDVNG